jgi:hypothetical protein
MLFAELFKGSVGDKRATSFNCPAEISFCTSTISEFKILAARFQEYGPSAKAETLGAFDVDVDSVADRFLAYQLTSEARVIRGSRTRSVPLAINCRNRVRLILSNFRKARWDHPSLTLALIPSAPSRKRTARSERPRRSAILSTGSYPPSPTKLRHRPRAKEAMGGAILIGPLCAG